MTPTRATLSTFLATTAAALLTACGGGGALDNPPDVANPPGEQGQKLSYVYFQRCVNPVLNAQLRVVINGVATTIWKPKLVKMFIAMVVKSASALSKASSRKTVPPSAASKRPPHRPRPAPVEIRPLDSGTRVAQPSESPGEIDRVISAEPVLTPEVRRLVDAVSTDLRNRPREIASPEQSV